MWEVASLPACYVQRLEPYLEVHRLLIIDRASLSHVRRVKFEIDMGRGLGVAA